MPDALKPQEPTAVEKYFFTPLYYPRGPLDVIFWWERRRLAYNVCVGTAGILTLATMFMFAPGPGSAMRDFGWLVGAGIYGVMANACYSLGWVADLTLRRFLGIRAPDIAPALLRYGFVFAMGLTLLPIPVMLAVRVAMLALGVKA